MGQIALRFTTKTEPANQVEIMNQEEAVQTARELDAYAMLQAHVDQFCIIKSSVRRTIHSCRRKQRKSAFDSAHEQTTTVWRISEFFPLVERDSLRNDILKISTMFANTYP